MSATKLKTQAIEDNAITTPKIADAQITQPKLASGVGGNTDHSFRIKTSGTSVPDNTDTIMTWNEESDFDTDNLHDNAVNNSRVTITAPTAGKWLILATIMFPNPPTGLREGVVKIIKNGGLVNTGAMGLVGPIMANHTIAVSSIINLAAGDYLEILVRHNYGVTTSIGGGLPQGGSFFQGIRIAT